VKPASERIDRRHKAYGHAKGDPFSQTNYRL